MGLGADVQERPPLFYFARVGNAAKTSNMPIRYFKKLTPQTDVVLSNNARVVFTTLDGLTGYFATGNEFVQGELVRAIQEQRYGLTEISEDDFKAEYLEKKNQTQAHSSSWREEWGSQRSRESRSNPLTRLGAGAVAAAVGVNSTDIPKSCGGHTMADPVPAAKTGVPQPVKRDEFVPPKGTRPKPKQ